MTKTFKIQPNKNSGERIGIRSRGRVKELISEPEDLILVEPIQISLLITHASRLSPTRSEYFFFFFFFLDEK